MEVIPPPGAPRSTQVEPLVTEGSLLVAWSCRRQFFSTNLTPGRFDSSSMASSGLTSSGRSSTSSGPAPWARMERL